MTDKLEIVDVYLNHIGKRRVQGNTLEPILPFLMLDVMYQMYCEDILPIVCRQRLKAEKNKWSRNYAAVNHQFFSAFDQNQQDKVIDLMDDFESYIHNDLVVTRVSVMEELNELPTDDAKVCATLVICNILAQTAGIIWNNVFVGRSNRPERNKYIDAIEKATCRFTDIYLSERSNMKVNPNDSDRISRSVKILCSKMIKFLTL